MKDLMARDIMSSEVLTVKESMTVRELAAFLAQNEISGTPVEGADGALVGVVSVTDVAAVASGSSAFVPDRSNPSFYVHGWEERANPDELYRLHIEDEGLLVRDIMTPAVYSVPSAAPIPEIAGTMAKAHLHRLLVMDDGKVVGIISAFDVLRLMAG